MGQEKLKAEAAKGGQFFKDAFKSSSVPTYSIKVYVWSDVRIVLGDPQATLAVCVMASRWSCWWSGLRRMMRGCQAHDAQRLCIDGTSRQWQDNVAQPFCGRTRRCGSRGRPRRRRGEHGQPLRDHLCRGMAHL